MISQFYLWTSGSEARRRLADLGPQYDVAYLVIYMQSNNKISNDQHLLINVSSFVRFKITFKTF